MKAYITANKGFVSAEMDVEQAVIYARQLRNLGNVDVRVVHVNALKTGNLKKTIGIETHHISPNIWNINRRFESY
ncbi:hypothetical protein ACFPYJ_12225 [Paenibacillus solisilvae]|uniref:Uncharacterized protein n=1 Tax=Paenibacillus solisilvae TaxID=2486751 RepID=A0ABW0W0E4_9BACL